MTPYEVLRKAVKDRREAMGSLGDSETIHNPSNHQTGLRLGDLVEKALRWLGIKAKPSCGCKRRKEFLNKLA